MLTQDTSTGDARQEIADWVSRYVEGRLSIDGGARVARRKHRYVYVPLPFNFFTGNKLKSIKDLTFLENLQVVCDFGPLFGVNGAGSMASQVDINTTLTETAPAATAARRYNSADARPKIVVQDINDTDEGLIHRSALIVNYLNIPNEQLRALQQATFKLENNKPLSILSANVYDENPVSYAAGANKKDDSIRIDLNCKHVVYQTLVALRAGNRSANEFHTIKRIEMYLSGRKVMEYKNTREIAIENAFEMGQQQSPGLRHDQNRHSQNSDLFHGNNGAVQVGHTIIQHQNYDETPLGAPIVKEHTEKVYTINHNIDRDPLDRQSGCVSFKNTSSPYLMVYFDSQNGVSYQAKVTHRHYSVASIAGSDGSVNISLSL